jgi:hypothetical protein
MSPGGRRPRRLDLRYASAYVNRQGQWRMLALQMQRRVPD